MLPSAQRERPQVPNHELVRVIGRGAYGEIWMARSLTGALRAVKIVDRRTFENERSFEREFEGMARFEPISRSDAGFVDILHVGRDPGGHFFYYVMELADDVTGRQVEAEAYVPKTLRTELRRRSRLLAGECLAIGLSLTRALGVLHGRGLVHRDIKPANVIFVGGVPKIADIGLVAASGEGSFVGTEGYVPPEGPGTVAADLFSLGKVLYEMAMGKDRLDFPALHSDLTRLPDKDGLMALNAVLMKVCAPNPRQRYASAEEMHEDLERLTAGRPMRSRGRRLAPFVMLAMMIFGAGAGVVWWHRQPGSVRIETEPQGAMVVLDSGGTIRSSPTSFDTLAVGRHSARVMLAGYDARVISFEVKSRRVTAVPKIQLARSHGQLVITSIPSGADFTIRRGDSSIASGQTPANFDALDTGEYDVDFRMAGSSTQERVQVVRDEPASVAAEFVFGRIAVTSEPVGAELQVDGMPAGTAPREIALAQGAHEIVAHFRSWPEQRQKIELARAQDAAVVFKFPRGSVKITSAPAGASVFAEGRQIGKAPLLLEDLEPGAVAYELRMSEFEPVRLTGEVKPGGQTFLGGRLTQRVGPLPGKPWENSLHMKFVPVGNVLAGVGPVQVGEYEAFCQASGRARLLPDFEQEPTHPAVRVNWNDAVAFCEWLTTKEQQAGVLEAGQIYRLPTDLEWSAAAGLPAESGATPEERDGKLPDFPWGRQWPPPTGAGNFADASVKRSSTRIPGYRDGFAQTSPVGNFAANALGLFDMSGNVWQWVLDSYNTGARGKDWGVLRGGSWGTAAQAELRCAYRNVVDRSERDVIFGFRVVVVPESEP